MTRDEILKLDGRELDEAVALKVMGWTCDGDYFHDADGKQVACPHGSLMVDIGRRDAWSPSTDIAAAMEVWRKLWCPVVSNNWMACLDADGYNIGVAVGGAEDIPAAICRAALLAAEGAG